MIAAYKYVAANARKYQTTPTKITLRMQRKTTRNSLHTYSKFQEARNIRLSIHYWHLKNWMNEESISISSPNFKASIYFLHRYKRHNKTTPRKITQFFLRLHAAIGHYCKNQRTEVCK